MNKAVAIDGQGRGATGSAAFLQALAAAGFEGDLSASTSDRMVLATDNSIYQIPPDAVVFPRSATDLAKIMTLLDTDAFVDLVIRPRGGGTGTNGQSLGRGVVVDCSRHMTAILEINAADGWVRVEPGVIKDRLNEALAPHSLFFAPELSTSSRATLGGMISTDACGQGSCLYGKTSDHVLSLNAVLIGGEMMTTGPEDPAALADRPGRAGAALRLLARIAQNRGDLIAERFPKMNRSLTGYDLAHIARDGGIDAGAVICGAEGTLALIAEARLRVLPIPKVATLVNVFYDDFDAALRDAPFLGRFGASSVETIDSRVLALAREDPIWREVTALFPDEGAEGVNIVEYTGDNAASVMRRCDALIGALTAGQGRRGHTVGTGGQVASVWAMRKKAVGLLGRSGTTRRPIPFVEDCAVPPENLADFIAAFRAILDEAGLQYGMFGHVDAGVLHVRPALDLIDPADEPRIRTITEAVQTLARAHGGLLWGEHGKGLRSEFVPEVFGPLYADLQAIKAVFDPRNQLNPGKIATPDATSLTPLDAAPLRAQADRQIAPARRAEYSPALACNGNGACFAQSAAEVMCPSYKATLDRRHSPKGRAGLIREWLRQGGPEERADPVFEAEVKAAMDGCLSCRACARSCPVQVDVPSFRAKFLHSWHARHRRPLRDHALAHLEGLLPLMERLRPLSNALLEGPGAGMLARLGLVSLPTFPKVRFHAEARRQGLSSVAQGTQLDPARDVVIVPDAFTRYFEPGLLLDLAAVMRAMGFVPWLAPYRPSGKPRHVLGQLADFARQARRQTATLSVLAAQGVALVGIEPAVTLAYATDYPEATGETPPPVLLPQEWLSAHLDRLPASTARKGAVVLLSHCTGSTERPEGAAQWAAVMEHLGVTLETPPTGCCGMAGTWGHLSENQTISETIFANSWAPVLQHAGTTGASILATGFSCRCQVGIRRGAQLRHPVALLRTLIDPASQTQDISQQLKNL